MKKKDPKNHGETSSSDSIPLHKDYSLNERELRAYVRWLAKIDGIDGIVCNGHTGEITPSTRRKRGGSRRSLPRRWEIGSSSSRGSQAMKGRSTRSNGQGRCRGWG